MLTIAEFTNKIMCCCLTMYRIRGDGGPSV